MRVKAELQLELERLIAFRSVTGDRKQADLLFDYLEAEFAEIGLQIRRGVIEAFPYLICGTKSTTQSKILLQAHVDVVPAEPAQFRLVDKKGHFFGRGAYDMLFATAAYLQLARELHKEAVLSKLDMGFMFTSDEEIGGFNGVGELTESYACDLCILPDAGNSKQICVASKGVLILAIKAVGVAGHSSRPSQAKNPIEPLLRFAADTTDSYKNTDEQQTTVVITQFISGGATNQIPHAGQLTLDIRYRHQDKPNEILDTIRTMADTYALTIEVLEHADAFTNAPGGSLTDSFGEVYEKHTGTKLGEITEPGSSDARFFARKNIPVIMMRPEGGGLHGEKEWVDAASLEQFYTILKAYVTKEAIS